MESCKEQKKINVFTEPNISVIVPLKCNHQGHFVSARVVHNYSYLVSVCIKMDPACVKMTILVFTAVFASSARSQTQHSIGPYPTSDTERCVCQPHITVNPPVCGRSLPVNSVAGCNCTTVQEILRTVSINQEDTTRKVDTVSSELTDTKRIVEELQDTVSAVSSEVQGLRRQLEDLQVSVSNLVEFLHVRRKFAKKLNNIVHEAEDNFVGKVKQCRGNIKIVLDTVLTLISMLNVCVQKHVENLVINLFKHTRIICIELGQINYNN